MKSVSLLVLNHAPWAIGELRAGLDLKKVQAIWDWTAPSMVTELRSFLALANCYRRFIEVITSRQPLYLIY